MSFAAVESEAAREGLRLLQAGIHQAATLALRGAVKAAEDSAKGTTLWKDKSGATRASVRGEVVGETGIVSTAGAAKFLENGTAAHQIVARNARMLHFFVNGQEFFRRMVQHPGTKERPFMRQARERGEIALEYGAEYYVNYAIARA